MIPDYKTTNRKVDMATSPGILTVSQISTSVYFAINFRIELCPIPSNNYSIVLSVKITIPQVYFGVSKWT